MKEQTHVYKSFNFTTLNEVTEWYDNNDPFNVETKTVIYQEATAYDNAGVPNWYIITCTAEDKPEV